MRYEMADCAVREAVERIIEQTKNERWQPLTKLGTQRFVFIIAAAALCGGACT